MLVDVVVSNWVSVSGCVRVGGCLNLENNGKMPLSSLILFNAEGNICYKFIFIIFAFFSKKYFLLRSLFYPIFILILVKHLLT